MWCCRFVRQFLPAINLGERQHNLFLVGVWQIEVFSWLNSTFNFFVYFVMGSRFRVTLWGLLGRKVTKATLKNTAMTSRTEVTED